MNCQRCEGTGWLRRFVPGVAGGSVTNTQACPTCKGTGKITVLLIAEDVMKNPPMDAAAFAKWLNDQGACRVALKWQSGKTLRETWDTCERGDWLKWLLKACNYQWTAPAYEAYQKAKLTAYEAYLKATAPAEEAYPKAKATAKEAYLKATAPAYEAYLKAKAESIRELIPYPFK